MLAHIVTVLLEGGLRRLQMVEKISDPCVSQAKNWTETQITKQLEVLLKVRGKYTKEGGVGSGQMVQKCHQRVINKL
jgi:hypothetical protein